MKRAYSLLILPLFFVFHYDLAAQEGSSQSFMDSVSTFLYDQVSQYPQEKIHVHIDKPNYLAGERIWFRAHMVDALFHKQANASRYVYVELVNPLDSVVNRVKIRPDSMGYFHGYIPIDEGVAEGNYTLRAYTMYMKNLGEDYFYRKTVPVIDPLSGNFDIETAFSSDDRRTTAVFRFLYKYSGEAFTPDNLTFKVNRQPWQKLKFDSDSMARFTFRTPAKEEQRVLTLRFTYEGKVYTKYLYIPAADDEYDVTFHPEGGNMLAGTDNRVAFKAVDANGLSKNITGKVLDGDDNELTEFMSEHLGMGFFHLRPGAEQKYYAVCTDGNGLERRFELPTAVGNYVGLQLSHTPNNLYVQVNRTPDFNTVNKIYLVGLMRGVAVFFDEWDYSSEHLSFDKSSFPSGLYQFVLLDGERNILSERLFFSYLKDYEPEAVFSTDKSNYAARESITSTVKFTDFDGTPLSGNFSVSVTDDKDVTPDSTTTIVSTLLLTSELKGHIENPAQYFAQTGTKATFQLDLLMMTQGWRRYPISEVVRGNIEVPEIFPELSQIITGKADGLFGSGNEATISILALHDEFSDVNLAYTDHNGRFVWNDFEYPDSTRFLFQARTKKDRGNLAILVDHDDPYPGISSRLPGHNPDSGQISGEYIYKADQKYVDEHGMRVVNLEGVTVTARRKQPTESRYYSPISSSRVITEEEIDNMHITTMQSLLMRLGVSVSGGNVSIRGNSPLVVIDDLAHEDYNILTMNVNDVADIYLIKDASVGAIFGQRGMNGAIVVTTKRGYVETNARRDNISDFIRPLGYQRPVEFYSPRYDTGHTGMPADLRTTIYWKPDVTVPQSGQAEFDFYSADAPTTYSVIIEGVSDEGHAIRKVATIDRSR